MSKDRQVTSILPRGAIEQIVADYLANSPPAVGITEMLEPRPPITIDDVLRGVELMKRQMDEWRYDYVIPRHVVSLVKEEEDEQG